MSNSLQDHMAEVLLRAIIRFPDRCPPDLASAARWYWDARNQYLYGAGAQIKYVDEYLSSKRRYRQRLAEFSDRLPAILADYEP
jgi:hypothetical protein